MKGFQIDFKTKKDKAGIFNITLYGRLSSRTQNGKYYTYYIAGLLDNIPFFKIMDGRIFVSDTEGLDLDSAFKYCDSYKITACEKNDNDIFMKTGRERLLFKAKERGITVYGFN